MTMRRRYIISRCKSDLSQAHYERIYSFLHEQRVSMTRNQNGYFVDLNLVHDPALHNIESYLESIDETDQQNKQFYERMSNIKRETNNDTR